MFDHAQQHFIPPLLKDEVRVVVTSLANEGFIDVAQNLLQYVVSTIILHFACALQLKHGFSFFFIKTKQNMRNIHTHSYTQIHIYIYTHKYTNTHTHTHKYAHTSFHENNKPTIQQVNNQMTEGEQLLCERLVYAQSLSPAPVVNLFCLLSPFALSD